MQEKTFVVTVIIFPLFSRFKDFKSKKETFSSEVLYSVPVTKK